MDRPAETSREITELLAAHAAGDDGAFDRLVPLVYDDLRRIARRQMAREADGHTLDTTAVVHEAYLRIARGSPAGWPDRAHFFAFSARAMRHILIDHARRRQRARRGGGWVRVPMDDLALGASDPTTEVLALDEALRRLAERHERMARVVEYRLFGDMSPKDTARALGVSISTVERDWRAARAYLYRELGPDRNEGPLPDRDAGARPG